LPLHLYRDLPVLFFRQFSDLVLCTAWYLPLPPNTCDVIFLILSFFSVVYKIMLFIMILSLSYSSLVHLFSAAALPNCLQFMFLPPCDVKIRIYSELHTEQLGYCEKCVLLFFLYDTSKLYVTIAVHFNYTMSFLGTYVNRIYVLLVGRPDVSAWVRICKNTNKCRTVCG
jgi:hypothetical protein